MRFLFFHTVTNPVLMCKNKIKIIRPARMSCDNLGADTSVSQKILEFNQGSLSQFVVFCQRIDKTVASVGAEPDRIAGKQICIIDQINHVTPCMSRHKDSFHLYIVYIKHITVPKKFSLIIAFDHRELIQTKDNPASFFPRHILILARADIQLCVFEQSVRVTLHGSDMIRVLMRDKDIMYIRRIYIQPPHLLSQPLIVVSGIYHDRCSVFGIKKDIGDPFTYTCHMIVDASGIQRFENFFTSISP